MKMWRTLYKEWLAQAGASSHRRLTADTGELFDFLHELSRGYVVPWCFGALQPAED